MITFILDIEIYRDYFLALFMETTTKRILNFEMYDGKDFAVNKVFDLLKTSKIVTFNGINYDLPLLTAVLCGASCQDVKNYSDKIITENKKAWQIGLKSLPCDHIDLIEVAPGVGTGLKAYMGRMHSKRMQDLPIEPDASISVTDRQNLKTYCANDLSGTFELYESLRPQIELREKMGEQYGVDLRSKSDAQIAEAIIKLEVAKLTGKPVGKPVVDEELFIYDAPNFLKEWLAVECKDVLEDVESSYFSVKANGSVELPDYLDRREIKIGNSSYKIGIGGLHSKEKKVIYKENEEYVISEHDVRAYYPSIILNCGLAPSHMAEAFSIVYKEIVDKRIAAKKAGDKVTDSTYKILINGSFGKFGNKYSTLYSPKLLIQTTVTGQLSLLMLIEMLEHSEISVVSANTDGIVVKCKRTDIEKRDFLIRKWEEITGFNTEQTNYKSIYFRDVNNYIAIKEGSVKTKGAYAIGGLMKNPTNTVCVEAVINLLTKQIPIEDTINAETDIRKFVTVRKVNGGALDHAGNYLGKTIRWYYSKDVEIVRAISPEHGHIKYKINGNKVPKSDGAMGIMELPDEVPDDLNREWYIKESKSILKDIGYE